MGTYLGGSDSIALRDVTGAWSDAYPIGMHPDVTILNGGAPAFLALGGGVGLSRGPSAGGLARTPVARQSNNRNCVNFPKCEFKHRGSGPIARVHEPNCRHRNEQAQESVLLRIA